jgi:hypothetical protein
VPTDAGSRLRRVPLLRGWRRRLHRHPQPDRTRPPTQKIYHRVVSHEVANEIDTGRYIIENLTVHEHRQLLVCNANEFVVVYDVRDAGRDLCERYRFQADLSPRHGNVVLLPPPRTPSASPHPATFS